MISVPARPYAYQLDPAHTALVVIDMQRDFIEPGGFGASLGLLRRGGPLVMLFLVASSVFTVLQNVLGVIAATLLGQPPLFGVLAGSVTLAGGPATGLAFAPLFEQAGVAGADTIAVAAGETVTFSFTNDGSVVHDAFVGDRHAQADHEEDMAGGGHHGDDGDAVTVDPGDTETLTHTFDEPGLVEIGCHQPGHYASGMKVDVTVT